MRVTRINILIGTIAVLLVVGSVLLYRSRSSVTAGKVAPEPQNQTQNPQATKPSTAVPSAATSSPPLTAQATTKEATASNSPAPGTAVAMVNGTAITPRQLEDELNRLLMSQNAHAGIDSKKKDEMRKIALDELVVRELAYQKAKSSGVSIDPLQVVAETRRIRNRYHTKKSFADALTAEGITEQQLRERVERDLMLKKIFQLEIADRAKVTEAEARQYYETNKEKFVVPESVQFKGILIKVGSGGDVEAKRRIDELAAKLKNGSDFGELAYKYSEDDYRVMGGDYGSVHRGQLPADWEQVVFAQKPGVLSAPFKTSLGWHIALVTSKQPTHQLIYAEVADKIRTALSQQRQKQRRDDFIAALRATATIEYQNQ